MPCFLYMDEYYWEFEYLVECSWSRGMLLFKKVISLSSFLSSLSSFLPCLLGSSPLSGSSTKTAILLWSDFTLDFSALETETDGSKKLQDGQVVFLHLHEDGIFQVEDIGAGLNKSISKSQFIWFIEAISALHRWSEDSTFTRKKN